MEQNSGEKERSSCMSLNFGMVWNKILVKKTPSVITVGLGCCAAENNRDLRVLFVQVTKQPPTHLFLST